MSEEQLGFLLVGFSVQFVLANLNKDYCVLPSYFACFKPLGFYHVTLARLIYADVLHRCK